MDGNETNVKPEPTNYVILEPAGEESQRRGKLDGAALDPFVAKGGIER
jgi:hypothetical protein